MKKKYFDMQYNYNKFKDHWFLDITWDWFIDNKHHGLELNDLLRRKYDEPIPINVYVNGKPQTSTMEIKPVDFFFSLRNPPIVIKDFGNLLQKFCNDDIERIPILIKGLEVESSNYELIKLYREIDCIDIERSVIIYNKDPQHPTLKVGDPIHFSKVKLDTSKIGDYHMFKIKFNHSIYVSDELKQEIEKRGFTGIRFVRV